MCGSGERVGRAGKADERVGRPALTSPIDIRNKTNLEMELGHYAYEVVKQDTVRFWQDRNVKQCPLSQELFFLR